MQGVFSPTHKTSERGTLLKLASRERCVVQLKSTMAVVCLQLDSPLQDPLFRDLVLSVRPEAPLPCAVVLGAFHLARGEYTGCRIHVAGATRSASMHAGGAQSASMHAGGAQSASNSSTATHIKYKDYKQPFCGLPGLLPVFL